MINHFTAEVKYSNRQDANFCLDMINIREEHTEEDGIFANLDSKTLHRGG